MNNNVIDHRRLKRRIKKFLIRNRNNKNLWFGGFLLTLSDIKYILKYNNMVRNNMPPLLYTANKGKAKTRRNNKNIFLYN